jgi:REP element-mobilizing transposase RayT
MSRPLRLEFSGALYHVTSRGDNRKAIYFEETDFDLFLTVLNDVCE